MSKNKNNVATQQDTQETVSSIYRFKIEVTSFKESIVTDNETGKVYKCRNEWYPRTDRNGKRFQHFYVNVKDVEGKSMKDKFTFPWNAEIKENGKLKGTSPIGQVIETNLAGKQATSITADMFEN